MQRYNYRRAPEAAKRSNEPKFHPCELAVDAHQPLMVKSVPNRVREGDWVAFINGQLCFFDKKHMADVPTNGAAVEVMIVNALWKRKESGGYDYTRLLALVLRPVTSAVRLLTHDGFECSGTMCRTMAGAWENGKLVANLTPGLELIFVANNVNARPSYMSKDSPNNYGYNEPVARRPGRVWVDVERLAAGMARVEGVARVSDLNDHILAAMKS